MLMDKTQSYFREILGQCPIQIPPLEKVRVPDHGTAHYLNKGRTSKACSMLDLQAGNGPLSLAQGVRLRHQIKVEQTIHQLIHSLHFLKAIPLRAHEQSKKTTILL